MTSTLIEQSPVLVQAIHEAFRDSGPCHCHGAGKLSEKEVVRALVRLHHVAAVDVQRQNVPSIMEALGAVRHNPWYDLEQAGAKCLTDLQGWTYADLLGVDAVGPITATQIEAEMSRYGLALKDGDPSRYRQLLEDQKEKERPVADLPPDEVREHCAKELMSAGQQFLQYGAIFIRYGFRASRRVRVGKPLKKTIKAGISAIHEIESVGHLLHDLEQREAASRPLTKRAPRVPAEARQQGNVITGAFVPPADPPDPWAHGVAS